MTTRANSNSAYFGGYMAGSNGPRRINATAGRRLGSSDVRAMAAGTRATGMNLGSNRPPSVASPARSWSSQGPSSHEQVLRGQRPPLTQIGPRALSRLQEVGPARVNPPVQLRRDRHPPSIRIGLRVLHRLREVGPARVHPHEQVLRNQHPSLTRIAGCRISETLNSAIPHSAILRSPMRETNRASVTSGVRDSAVPVNLSWAPLPLIEKPRSVETISRLYRTYLAWR